MYIDFFKLKFRIRYRLPAANTISIHKNVSYIETLSVDDRKSN